MAQLLCVQAPAAGGTDTFYLLQYPHSLFFAQCANDEDTLRCMATTKFSPVVHFLSYFFLVATFFLLPISGLLWAKLPECFSCIPFFQRCSLPLFWRAFIAWISRGKYSHAGRSILCTRKQTKYCASYVGRMREQWICQRLIVQKRCYTTYISINKSHNIIVTQHIFWFGKVLFIEMTGLSLSRLLSPNQSASHKIQ